MGNNFREMKFGEFISIQRGHDLSEKERVKGDIPVAGSNGIVGFHNESKGIVPGITIGRSGSIGNVNLYKNPYFPLNTTLYVTNFNNNDPLFTYYFLKNFDFTSFDSGSVQPSLNRNFINPANVKIPEITTQKAIAQILGTLDDKIELNQKMNQTLEDIAKAIFKSWFIDFDPVRAKVEGKPTGLSDEISDLFPDEFIEYENSLIPKNWILGSFGDVIKPQKGKVITKSLVEDGTVPVVAGGISPAYFHNKFNAQSPIVTISASGTAGYVNIYYENIWASDCSYINKSVTDYVYFAYLFLKHNQEIIYHKRHGAVQQHIYPKDLMEIPLNIPSSHLFSAFENLITPFFEKISINLSENKLLESLRDSLLPKLISGELQISDSEKFLKEAGI